MSTKKAAPRIRVLSVLLGLTLCLTGCSGGSGVSSTNEDAYSETLYANRVTIFSDTAAVETLLAQMGISDRMGTYTIEANSSEQPYTLTLHFAQTPKDSKVFADQFEYYAALLLALVDNCGLVRGIYPSGSDTRSAEWTTQQLNDRLNVNIVRCGKSAEGVATLLDTIHSTHAGNKNFAVFFEEQYG